jgi:cytochrome b6
LGVAGELVGILAFGLGGLLLVLVPFLDRRAAREQPSRLFTLVGAVVILYMLTMTLLGFVLK